MSLSIRQLIIYLDHQYKRTTKIHWYLVPYYTSLQLKFIKVTIYFLLVGIATRIHTEIYL